MTRPLHPFDMRAFAAALDTQRQARGLTWTELTAAINAPFRHVPSIPISLSTIGGMTSELPGFTESMLTNLATGPAIGFPRVMLLTQWLERPASTFMRGFDW